MPSSSSFTMPCLIPIASPTDSSYTDVRVLKVLSVTAKKDAKALTCDWNRLSMLFAVDTTQIAS